MQAPKMWTSALELGVQLSPNPRRDTHSIPQQYFRVTLQKSPSTTTESRVTNSGWATDSHPVSHSTRLAYYHWHLPDLQCFNKMARLTAQQFYGS